MTYTLYTTEKPSVAKDIAKVLMADKRCDGYYEGNGCRVTWAVGHLVGLAEPELYNYMSQKEIWDKENPNNKEVALKELPLIPNEFKLVVLQKTKQQFEVMKKLMNDPNCTEVIDCGDAGEEGSILQWFIRVKAGCTKPVKRFIATSMTEEAIRTALNNLHNINDYTPIIKGEFCKKKADWIMGMSMSRCASIIYNAKVDVGRVQSPTLYFVVQRYLAVKKFKATDYFQIRADFKEGLTTLWTKDTNGTFPQSVKDIDNRLLMKELADKTASEIESLGEGKVTLLETKNKAINRPQLYDIVELERDGNRIFGYTADMVLKTAQSLYEKHKITSYPRTDSRYITSDLVPYMANRIKQISTHGEYKNVCDDLINKGLNIDKRIADDTKVTDHHAIICTEKIENYDLQLLSEIERNILNLIITRMIEAFSDLYKYQETNVEVTFSNGFAFGASGKIPISMGWKAVSKSILNENDKEDNKEQLFTDLQLNQLVHINKIEVLAKKTTPPNLHTEATLLTAMENAGNSLDNGAILKGKGIGTQSTRASIIASLFNKGYIANSGKGKTKFLVPTKQGINVIKVLPKELYSPKITADWEEQISKIVSGELSERDFMNNFKTFINAKVDEVINNKKDNIDFSRERPLVGKCPWCKNDVYMGMVNAKNGDKLEVAYCSNKECKFSIIKQNAFFKKITGRDITLPQLTKLVNAGAVEVTGHSNDKSYKAIISIKKNDKGYVGFDMSFDNKSKPKSKVRRKNNW